jgi:hypothetical protein
VGDKDENDINKINMIYMDLGSSMVLSPPEEGDDVPRYLVNFAT